MELVMHSRNDSDDIEAREARETGGSRRAQSFRERHALKILGAIMVLMFATVILVQVAC
jgi:hypothetical protein